MKLDELIGNNSIKLQLKMASQAAVLKNEAVPHTLFSGMGGSGKTSYAKALAEEQGSPFIQVNSETLKSSKEVLRIFGKLSHEGYSKNAKKTGKTDPTIVFFDEIHNMPLAAQETIGIAMENWEVTIKDNTTGELTTAPLPNFTVVGATTLEGKLSKPFLDRFKLIFSFRPYSLEDSIKIVALHAHKRGFPATLAALQSIAIRGRGTPRLLVRYLDRVIDTHLVMGRAELIDELAETVFEIMGISKEGLHAIDTQFLLRLAKAGQAVGIDTMAILLDESKKTIETRIEPYLLKQGYILRTPSGRALTNKGRQYLIDNNFIEKRINMFNG